MIAVAPPRGPVFWQSYANDGVTSLGIDVNLFSLDTTNANRPVTLLL